MFTVLSFAYILGVYILLCSTMFLISGFSRAIWCVYVSIIIASGQTAAVRNKFLIVVVKLTAHNLYRVDLWSFWHTSNVTLFLCTFSFSLQCIIFPPICCTQNTVCYRFCRYECTTDFIIFHGHSFYVYFTMIFRIGKIQSSWYKKDESFYVNCL